MPQLNLPSVHQDYYAIAGNRVTRYFSPAIQINEWELISRDPFVVKFNNEHCLITNNKVDIIPNNIEYALLSSRKPDKRTLELNKLRFKGWLKHPLFDNLSTDEIIASWTNSFTFKEEDNLNGVSGLRPPQLGALHSILAHTHNPQDKGIVVMPTGTGKTETMLSALIACKSKKLLVTVPSDSLRTQLANKFISLGLLKQLGIITETALYPRVGIAYSGFQTLQNLRDFIEKSNVVITTMNILADCPDDQKAIIASEFTHLFVDEAHHSEARTWQEVIERFDKKKVFLFTATPYRNDGKTLSGKVIFRFSLKNAQEQKYYKEINYLPIREYDRNEADKKIAETAILQLRADITAGYDHILMARCVSKQRAKDVFKYYENEQDLKPVVIYTGIKNLKQTIEEVKNKQHKIIVCVNMLGEGFDLPNLKIAAIHDERQSLPITLQFIGRFTRTSYDLLGKASFITNIAYPPIHNELEELYARDTDWNLLLPRLDENATQKEIQLKNYIEEFDNIEESPIDFHNISPALSATIFKNTHTTWFPDDWETGIKGLGAYDYKFSSHNHNTLVITLGRTVKVDWGTFETVKNIEWDIIIVYWDLRPNINRVFVNTSFKSLNYESLLKEIFRGNLEKIKGGIVFRVFHDVKRLSLFITGARKTGQDVSFQQYFGKNTQDSIDLIEQATMIKNNFFGSGYRNGEKITLGCSVSGKIWSYSRGNLKEFTEWCNATGDVVTNEAIDPNTVLRNTLRVASVDTRPNVMPISIEWHPNLYKYSEDRITVSIDGNNYNLFDIELNIIENELNSPLAFTLNTPDKNVAFRLELSSSGVGDQKTYHYDIVQTTTHIAKIVCGPQSFSLKEFFINNVPTIRFADNSLLYGNNYIKEQGTAESIPAENIITDAWTGVSLDKESRKVNPIVTDSIQHYFIHKIIDEFDIVYDDDGPGEIADIIGIKDTEELIDIHLYHLKFAKNGQVSNDIDNLYQVCGQAQKSVSWKYKSSKDLFNHLMQRKTKKLGDETCSRIVKGSEEQLEKLMTAAKWKKEVKFHIYIVQPSISKENASQQILQLLGSTYHSIFSIANIELKVYSSN